MYTHWPQYSIARGMQYNMQVKGYNRDTHNELRGTTGNIIQKLEEFSHWVEQEFDHLCLAQDWNSSLTPIIFVTPKTVNGVPLERTLVALCSSGTGTNIVINKARFPFDNATITNVE